MVTEISEIHTLQYRMLPLWPRLDDGHNRKVKGTEEKHLSDKQADFMKARSTVQPKTHCDKGKMI